MFETTFDTQPPKWEDLSYLKAWEYLKDYFDTIMYVVCTFDLVRHELAYLHLQEHVSTNFWLC